VWSPPCVSAGDECRAAKRRTCRQRHIRLLDWCVVVTSHEILWRESDRTRAGVLDIVALIPPMTAEAVSCNKGA
jgi:hypothetical protein